MSLTPKREKFCLAYIETGNASEAYRRAYDAENMSDKTVNEAASRLLRDSKVAARCGELRAETVKRHQFTVDDMIAQLDEDRKFARECATPAAAVSASMGKAKVLGFLVERIDAKVTEKRNVTLNFGVQPEC